VQNDEEEKEEKRNFYENLLTHISQEQFEGSYSNLECGLPCTEANSTANLVPFGEDIMELQICDFVVPVYINTVYSCVCPVFLGHTTHYHVY